MKLVIVAGGKGTRLGLKSIPKPMVKVCGKPVLQHQIELAQKYGINEIYILVGYKADIIFDYFKDGKDFGVKINYIVEPCPLGTAGSLKLLENLLKDRFMVFYGDIVLDMDLQHFIEFDDKYKPLASIVVHPTNHPFDSDLVEVDNNSRVVQIHPKPHSASFFYRNLSNSCVYIFSSKMFKYIPLDKSVDFGRDIFINLLHNKEEIRAYISAEYIKDMGNPSRLRVVRTDSKSGKISTLNRRNRQKAIFLDRDGVINKYVDNLSNIDDFKLIPGVVSAIKKINNSDYLSIVVTNQPVVAKGFLTEAELLNIHKKMETQLGERNAYLDSIYYCPHHPDKGFKGEVQDLKIICKCRKPKPGMLLRAAKDLNIDLKNSWMIGDSDGDLEAGKNAGCRTIYLNPKIRSHDLANYVQPNLTCAVKLILESDDK